MGNRVGLILHEDWEEFSPLLYSHYSSESFPIALQNYLRQYVLDHDINNNYDGHKYNPCHMLLGFIQSIGKDIHMRVENLSDLEIKKLKEGHECPNCFDNGCLIVNVSCNNYGVVSGDGYTSLILENENIVYDDFYDTENNCW